MRKFTLVFVALAMAITFPGMAGAAGFRLLETDTMGQGQAHAVSASVTDASAVYYNPAAMVEVENYSAIAGFQFVDPSGEYSGGGTTTQTANETFAVPHVYVVKNFADKGLAVGIGEFSNFGLGSNWSMYGPFRYAATNTQLKTSTFNVNVAKKIGDTFSVAVGVDYMNSNVLYDSMYPFGLALGAPTIADGITSIKGNGSAFGYNVAVLFKPTESVKIGVSYRSRVKVKYTGDITIQNFPTALLPLLAANGVSGNDYKSPTEVEVNYPEILIVGISFQATDKLRVEADADYTGWSSYDKLDFKFSKPLTTPTGTALLPATSTKTFNWDNVIAIRLGAAYQYNDKTELRFGFYHDPTPVPEKTFTPRVPDSTRELVAIGVGYKAMDDFTIDVSYNYLWGNTRSINNDVGAPFASVDGDYTATTHIFGASVGYRF